MFKIYFDESYGHPDLYTVAAYSAKDTQWREFNREWQAMLSDFGVKALHKTELESFQGEFKSWNADKRKEVNMKACGIIKRRVNAGFAAVFKKSDFDKYFVNVRSEWGKSYYACAVYTCLFMICGWTDKYAIYDSEYKAPFDYIFESGAIGEKEVNQLFTKLHKDEITRNKYRIGQWSFVNKSTATDHDAMPLQAADFLAYESYKQAVNRKIDGIKRPIRGTVLNLISNKGTPHYSSYVDKVAYDKFVEFCERKDVEG